MNCKPGDLAVIVGSTSRGGVFNGSLLRCVSVAYDDYWAVEPLSRPLIEIFEREGKPFIWDKRLRPIRDPGEDAKDETLSWLPVPTKEAA